MPYPTIPTLPDPPIRGTDAGVVFSDKTAALLDGLNPWTAAVNAFGVQLVTDAQSVIAGVASVNGQTGILTNFTENTAAQSLSNKTYVNAIFQGALREQQVQITGTTPSISPSAGTIRYWTLTANSTPTKGAWNDGEYLTLLVADGPAAAVNWTSMNITWVGGSPPSLPTSGFAIIELFQVNGVLYGAYAGAVA